MSPAADAAAAPSACPGGRATHARTPGCVPPPLPPPQACFRTARGRQRWRARSTHSSVLWMGWWGKRWPCLWRSSTQVGLQRTGLMVQGGGVEVFSRTAPMEGSYEEGVGWGSGRGGCACLRHSACARHAAPPSCQHVANARVRPPPSLLLAPLQTAPSRPGCTCTHGYRRRWAPAPPPLPAACWRGRRRCACAAGCCHCDPSPAALGGAHKSVARLPDMPLP